MTFTGSTVPPTPSTFYLAGPTAVGKTDLAIAVAEELGAEIVGCDAFQVYQGLSLLTAKPSPEAMARVPHHLIGEIPLSQSFDVGQYRALALRRIDEITARGKNALVVGGTGMYLRALSRGLADIPPADPEIRAQLNAQPLEDLLKQLEEADPVAFGQVDLKNRRRVVRALEVCILTGQPFSQFQGDWTESCSELNGVLLNRERAELYNRINERVEWMFESGVLAETSAAGPIGPTASQTLGLREIQAVLRGELDQAEALSLIQQATRRYAKRQATWFRREPWLVPVDLRTLLTLDEQVETVLQTLRKGPLN